MYLTPAHRLLLRRARPRVKVTDVKSDTTALTTYTFTNVMVSSSGPGIGRQQTLGTDQVMRSPSNKMVVVIVHSENSAVTFGISSVTIGGVAGFENVDRGGATAAINTAIYTWTGTALSSISNTNIVVTHTVAVTGCAIGVLEVDNVTYQPTQIASATNVSSTGAAISLGPTNAITSSNTNWVGICGTTCATGGGAETFIMGDVLSSGSTGLGQFAPDWLYDGSNANMAFAACYYTYPGYNRGDNIGRFSIDWSGTGAFDAAAVGFP